MVREVLVSDLTTTAECIAIVCLVPFCTKVFPHFREIGKSFGLSICFQTIFTQVEEQLVVVGDLFVLRLMISTPVHL